MTTKFEVTVLCSEESVGKLMSFCHQNGISFDPPNVVDEIPRQTTTRNGATEAAVKAAARASSELPTISRREPVFRQNASKISNRGGRRRRHKFALDQDTLRALVARTVIERGETPIHRSELKSIAIAADYSHYSLPKLLQELVVDEIITRKGEGFYVAGVNASTLEQASAAVAH